MLKGRRSLKDCCFVSGAGGSKGFERRAVWGGASGHSASGFVSQH